MKADGKADVDGVTTKPGPKAADGLNPTWKALVPAKQPLDEFAIMKRIGKLLDQLPSESRGRVTGWLLERLGEGQQGKRRNAITIPDPAQGLF